MTSYGGAQASTPMMDVMPPDRVWAVYACAARALSRKLTCRVADPVLHPRAAPPARGAKRGAADGGLPGRCKGLQGRVDQTHGHTTGGPSHARTRREARADPAKSWGSRRSRLRPHPQALRAWDRRRVPRVRPPHGIESLKAPSDCGRRGIPLPRPPTLPSRVGGAVPYGGTPQHAWRPERQPTSDDDVVKCALDGSKEQGFFGAMDIRE